MSDTISNKQLAANRANAARSTGPRTAAGKSRSAQNARKHGFAGSDFTIVKIEDRDAVYQPINSQEIFAIERIALAQHALLRVARFEAGLFAVALNRVLFNLEDEQPFVPLHEDLHVDPQEIKIQNRNYCLAQGFHRMNVESPSSWPLFLRYQAQAERNCRRAVEEFERLKKLRPELPNEPISEAELEENKSPSAPENEPNIMPSGEGNLSVVTRACSH